MPLREDLLEPIGGDNPSGKNLRYDPVYDKIKDARRQEDELSQGIWAHDVKKADFTQVVKLASDALAKQSKDLQLAAWLTEALLEQEGVSGLRQGLEFTHKLLDSFWDTLYPELEDGDPFMRAGILDWMGSHLGDGIKRDALTKSGFNWFQFKESRSVGYEVDCANDSEKMAARSEAIADGRLAPEEFDQAVTETPKEYYAGLMEEVDSTLEVLKTLEAYTDEKFTEEPPGYSDVKSSLEDLQQTIRVLLAKKREQEPEEPPAGEPPSPESAAEKTPAPAATPPPDAPAPQGTATAPAPAGPAISAEPASREDAISRVVEAARFLRRDDAYSPIPYLMLRGLRWGELRGGGETIDQVLLEPPPTEIRQQLKRQALDGQWQEVLETGETGMGMPCGRGWLDLQRYAVRACSELGSWYDPIARGIRSELKALINDYPALPEMTLMDDTPTANAETQSWLRELMTPPEAASDVLAEPPDPTEEKAAPETTLADAVVDAYDLATQALESGRPEEAMGILTREIAQVKTGRVRFRRRMQLAQLCLASGRELIALPILQDLAAEIENRRLQEWEAPELLAHALVLLYRCISKLGRSPEEKQSVYERICRLDPVQAMACGE